MSFAAPNGQLVENGTQGEQQRSPRALSLLQMYADTEANTTVGVEINTTIFWYINYLTNESNWDEYGLNSYALLTGFVGLSVADFLQPWSTFLGIE